MTRLAEARIGWITLLGYLALCGLLYSLM